MHRSSTSQSLYWAIVLIAAMLMGLQSASAAPITIPTVPVGNPGNAPDQLRPSTYNAENLQFGAVNYDYRIGKTEVTNAQYAAFLNEKAKSDPLALYNTSMGSDARGGITRSGSDGSYTYATKPNMGDKPVNFVSWYDAVRFANWLHNGQGAGDTETGAYTLLGGTRTPTNGDSITRNPGASWWLPSEDEWYKAAYYQPAAEGGYAGSYRLYPTAGPPSWATANAVGDIANPAAYTANYNFGADWNSLNGNVTTVGSAGPLNESYYGTSDQGGNLWEWNESLHSEWFASFRGLRGGAWPDYPFALESSSRYIDLPGIENVVYGFRVATVPEPSTAVLGVIGCVLIGVLRKRLK